MIITDHHTLGDQVPEAAAVVHPRLPGHLYPFDGLCGAGVAFKLAWALCQRASNAQRVSPPMREFLVAAMGYAALGTVADVVPLIDENRILVHHGLHSLHRQPQAGIAALLDVTKLNEKPRLCSEDLAFTLAPRLNAAGRLGQAQLGVELLITQDATRARSLAEYIHQLNSSRDSLERSILLAANKQIKEQFDPGRRSGPGSGRSRMASRRHRHRGRATGREISPPGRRTVAGPGGGQARHRLGGARQAASTCTRRSPHVVNT